MPLVSSERRKRIEDSVFGHGLIAWERRSAYQSTGARTRTSGSGSQSVLLLRVLDSANALGNKADMVKDEHRTHAWHEDHATQSHCTRQKGTSHGDERSALRRPQEAIGKLHTLVGWK